MKQEVNPSKIMQVGLGFWASKVLLAAVSLDLFTLLSSGSKDAHGIQNALGLHGRGLYDFLDSLTSLGFLQREGLLETAKYSNAPDAEMFLVKGKPSYIGGILEMANNRLYRFWGSLEEALVTGKPQNEVKETGKSAFEAIYADHNRLEEFLKAMSGIQLGNFMAFSRNFDFSSYKTLCDMGGAGGALAILVAQNNPGMNCISFDLPPVEPIASRNILTMGVQDRVKTKSGNFFNDQFPNADVITMGNILHDWNEEEKLFLMKKACDTLPEGGAFVAIENVIDDLRAENTFGLLMSLNMLIETEGGFDYTAEHFKTWALEVGFRRTEIMPLTGPTSAAIAYK
jgi:hypothetical protein